MNKIEINFLDDGMKIFLDYVIRQYKKNPDYNPHPIIRAFKNALSGLEKVKQGENSMGVSCNGSEDKIYDPYCVVLKKEEGDAIVVQEIRNMMVNKTLPLDMMIIIFRIQIQLDKIGGETVSPQQMVDVLNKVIPGNRFYALGDRWKEARDLFKKKLEEKKISLPINVKDNKFIEEMSAIKEDTPWEDYPNNIRSLIGSVLKEKLDKNVRIIITSPKNSKIEKCKVFDSATEFLLGKTSEYVNLSEEN